MKNTARYFRLMCLGILILACIEVVFTRKASSAEPVVSSAEHLVAPDSNEKSLQGVAAELDQRRNSLDQKEKEVAERERRLTDREKEIDQKIQKLEALRLAVSGEIDAQKKNNEERVVKIVNVLETMTPKSAAGIFEAMEDSLAVDVIKRMDVRKVAKIMNIMDKTRSARLSEQMTGYYRIASSKTEGRAVASVTETKENPKRKEGENKNGEQSTRSR